MKNIPNIYTGNTVMCVEENGNVTAGVDGKNLAKILQNFENNYLKNLYRDKLNETFSHEFRKIDSCEEVGDILVICRARAYMNSSGNINKFRILIHVHNKEESK